MGKVIMAQFQVARTLATTLNSNFIKERRVMARRAQRRNSFNNFKKLIAKNKNNLRFAALSLTLGVLAGCAIAIYSGAYSLNFEEMRIEPFKAEKSTTVLAPVTEAVIPSPAFDLPPVAASGDETVIRLKLSTNLSFTNPSIGENQ